MREKYRKSNTLFFRRVILISPASLMSHRRITAPRDSIAARRITGIHIVDLGKTSTRMDMDIDIMEEIEAITRTGTAETTHQEAQSEFCRFLPEF